MALFKKKEAPKDSGANINSKLNDKKFLAYLETKKLDPEDVNDEKIMGDHLQNFENSQKASKEVSNFLRRAIGKELKIDIGPVISNIETYLGTLDEKKIG
ncbi:MAG: hypothetical protein WCP18_04105 [bacterium]